ncbi:MULTISPECIES: hypothetical protein [unclassified Microbacterium]|uniref:hypothetical protein n=1 Tax=unclassified Microbacterium TaxID=2609290 RepID=UPI0034287DD6
MRLVGGVVLWLVATVCGVLGAGWLSLAGVGWDGGFIARSYWDDSESGIGVGFAVILLIAWLGLLGGSFAVMRGGGYERSRTMRTMRTTSIVLAVVSIVGVLALCILAVGWPEPPTEYPSPPWNRA